MDLADKADDGSVVVIITADEWYAIRHATLIFADVVGQAPIAPQLGVTRSAAMKGRRQAYRLRDEIARISNSLGLSEL